VHFGSLTAREQAAFVDWYRTEYGATYRLALAVALNPTLAQDLTDEAFARALERWHRVGELDQPGAWVRRVTLNLIRRSWRQLGRESRAYSRHGIPGVDAVDDHLIEMLHVMRVLSNRERTAVALRYVLGMTEAEVATAMGVTTGTISTTLHRARRKLGHELGIAPPRAASQAPTLAGEESA
jgi:RNA polymerase sigma-70 factor (ECF subfamily)